MKGKVYLILTVALFCGKTYAQTAYTGMRGLSSLEIAAEMAPGVNLWNTLDAVCWWCEGCSNGLDSETVWGRPRTTPEMIQAIADRGFKSLRIPVTWFNHMGEYPDYTIDLEWLDRVEEVANYAFDANLYVIINMHHEDYSSSHEGSWLCPTYEKQDTVTDQLVKVWTQIATRFRDYGDYLIFETMNEPREVGGEKEWQGGTEEHREVINAFNLAALNAIRATGGNNETRFIMLPQVGANVVSAVEDMIIPNGDINTIVSVHAYYPYWFCIGDDVTTEWGTPEEVASLENSFRPLSEKFVENGIGVVMGEWGAKDKGNYDQRINYYETYTNICKENGITPIPWIYDFNRRTLSWEFPLVVDAIFQAFDTTYVHAKDLILNITSDTIYANETLQLTATILPDTASSQEVAWVSKNTITATVSSEGLVTGKARGSVEIVAATIGQYSVCNLVVLDTTLHLDFHYEAEDYENQSGVQAEACSDAGGGQNLGYINNGDWSSYFVIVDSTAIYNFSARVATATAGGTIEIRADNKIVGQVAVDGDLSNGWQDWYTTDPVEIELTEGNYELKLTYRGSGNNLFNINWFDIDYVRPLAVQDRIQEADKIKVYPNPFSDILYINYQLDSKSDVDMKIITSTGKVIQNIESCTGKLPGNYTISMDRNNLPDGMYFVVLRMDKKSIAKKIFVYTH